jgi:ribosome assembly protein YihI (activator of Der GTPase)
MRSILRRSAALLVAFGLLSVVGTAHADINPHKKLKEHVRSMVQEVKAAPTAERKRALLDEKLRGMIDALDRAEAMANLSSSDQEGLDALRTRLQEKLDELHGQNGYEAVPANQLNSFADYVQQDFEQADNTLTISLTTALLILILIVLLV